MDIRLSSSASPTLDSYAVVHSSCGWILLRSRQGRLTGLFFVGQKDCPRVQSFPAMRPARFDPAAGMLNGQSIRGLRVRRKVEHGANGELALEATTDVKGAASCEQGDTAFNMKSLLEGREALLEEEGGLIHLQKDTPQEDRVLLGRAKQELQEYFEGGRRQFDLPLSLPGTVFQRKVWEALLAIPFGELQTYAEIGRAAGLSSKHGRAVGQAVGRNPISIIIPCHRVIARNGMLTGYSGGLERKLALLGLEGFAFS